MDCPACAKPLDPKSISQKKTEKFIAQFRCPNCSKWITLNPRAEYMKLAGFSTLLLGSVVNFYISDSNYRLLLSLVAFIGACIAFIGFRKSKLMTLNEK